ncbi:MULTISPECIES: TonB-dependent receptor [unclassified Shewanella]|uniref:TonB-dependent receptor n=1 Tax=unclassified Shewanella TaxID=196818 RepID=UPI0020058C1C|nr:MULTISPECIES: TonB-dependent receptor [unclassified Shewanella]MCK7633684.1 TonB-dependent receptor [Shewanella sp. JNE17]MCK7648933.1 TonB-dependent receptor [Shewanella sp. JNE8]MCK7656990.1 TonB-dependent receptor [Shewanella sp. JNE4-2]UPO32656.1 TonB-dependent receptor [Shewanella sp. JNE2]
MHKNNLLAKSVRLALIGGMTATVLNVPFAFAEEQDGAKVERIAVTGSRIKRADMETSSPVSVIDASAIISSGAISVDEVLQKMTSAGGAMTNAGINNGSGGNTRINLRGLGTNRTLVLVNGRRMIASGTGAASTVDLNTIPVSMIQRVEVLKDGASAIYGTDAIAGVVNIILKRDFEGFEVNAQTGISAEGDADESTIDMTLGNTFDKGNIVVSAQYTKRGEASQADRGFSDCPITETKPDSNGNISLYCGGSGYAQGGHIWGDNNFGIVGSGPNGVYAIGDKGYYGEYVDNGEGKPKFQYFNGMSEANLSGRGGTYHDYVTANDAYNYAKDSYLFTPMERLNLTLAGTYELTENTRFFTEAMYSKRWSNQQMAPQPIWNNDAWVYNPISAGGWMTDDLLPWVQPGEELAYGRRMVESGTRDFDQVVDTIRIVVGVEGEFENGWSWDASYNKGRNDSVDTLANLHNLGSINAAVLEGTFDPFLQSSWQGDSIAPFIYTEVNSGNSELDIVAATLSGDLVDLPAGMMGFAAGYENRKEAAKFTPDSLTAQGLANDPRVEPTSGDFSVNEIYAELAIPLLSNIPLIQQLDLSAAMRYFDYSTFGDDTTWKLGLTWRVFDDLMLRGGLSTAFRAPTVDELYGGKSPSFEQIVHPATEQDQAEVTVGGNELLTPEEADITTIGLVYSPSLVDGLSMTIDYYNIEISNTITAVDNNYVANQCLDSTGNPINTDTALCQSSHIQIDNSGRIKFDNGLQNIGATNTSGYDINVAYGFDALGLDWKVGWDTSILTKYEEFDPDGIAVDYRGYVTGGVGAYAKLKSNLNITATADDWSFTYETRYIDGMDSFACIGKESSCYAPSVSSVVYHDLSGSYDLTNNIRLSGGINNLFDKEPPYYTGNNDSNTDPYTYDVLGRYFFLRASMKF